MGIKKLIKEFFSKIGFNKYKSDDFSSTSDRITDLTTKLIIKNGNNSFDGANFGIQNTNIYMPSIQPVSSHMLDTSVLASDLTKDQSIAPTIANINRHYREYYPSLVGGFVNRIEFAKCGEWINAGESIIIHGKAGSGKSGCSHHITTFCENNNIPYIAIKLDEKTPSKNPESWGHDLGLPASVAHCINSLSENKRAVIIFDQLDALRWTAAHSSDALWVCNDIIKQVKDINNNREHKISIVLICRTIDINHDTRISNLFLEKEDSTTQWRKLEIGDLGDTLLEELVGDKVFQKLSKRLIKLLNTPSNLYIWQRLESSEKYTACTTLSRLAFEWWNELSTKAYLRGISGDSMNGWKDDYVRLSEIHRKNEVPKHEMSKYIGDNGVIQFLKSNGLLKSSETVSLIHQSIWDCFIAEKMRDMVYKDLPIVDIVGAKEHQTPMRRYQMQLLLQDLVNVNSVQFLNFGQKLLNNSDIRYMIKSVFFEVFSQISKPDTDIAHAVIEYCKDDKYNQKFIENVLFAQPEFARILLREGVLDSWMQDDKKRVFAIRLICNIRQSCQTAEINFLRKYASYAPEHINSYTWCFSNDVKGDSDELFDLRMELYSQYPTMLTHCYFNLDDVINTHPIRCARLLSLAIQTKIVEQVEVTHRFKIAKSSMKDGINGAKREILDLLLPILPSDPENDRNWFGWYTDITKLERFCVAFIIELGVGIAKDNPDDFWSLFNNLLNTGYNIHNEIILNCILHMPTDASDEVINYLCKNFNETLFEKSSGNKDKLLLSKAVVMKHSMHCSPDIFDLLENTIIAYKSPNTKKYLEYRMRLPRWDGFDVHHSIWGDLQNELLSILPVERISPSSKELLAVLKRKFPNGAESYKYHKGHGGGVSSPVSGKKLSNQQWLGIIFNDRIKSRIHNKQWKEVKGGFVESSLEQYSSDFYHAVLAEPERFIRLILAQNKEIPQPYLFSLFGGVASSINKDDDNSNKVAIELLEEMILKLAASAKSEVASDVCSIIKRRYKDDWSSKIINILINIAINDDPPNPTIYAVTYPRTKDEDKNSFSKLNNDSSNNIRGRALTTMAQLLYEHESLISRFKPVIENLVNDEHAIIRLAAFDVVYAFWNYDRSWMLNTAINMIKYDYRLAGHGNAGQLLFMVYEHMPSHKKDVLNIFTKCYNSDDEVLIKKGAAWVTESYICFGEFTDIFVDISIVSKDHAEAMLSMAIVYFDIDEYRVKAEELCNRFITAHFELPDRVSRLFYDKKIDLARDRNFVDGLMCSKYASRLFYLLIRYFKKDSASLLDYQDIIFNASSRLLQNNQGDDGSIWGLASEISSVIVGLYDETTESNSHSRKIIAQKCLDIWDVMFERQIGDARKIMHDIADR